MRNLSKFLVVFACMVAIAVAVPTKNEKDILRETKSELTGLYQKLQHIGNRVNKTGEHMFGKKNRTETTRAKRQLAFGGGFGMGFGAYDYNDYYGEYVSDYAYDYYDWICSDTACQLCDILTSECCDPVIDVNCFLPDSCLNNPCLSGGTCITTRTLDNQPDFICVCLPGLTGKYCQLVNDYFVGAEIAFAPAVAAIGGAGMIAPGMDAGGATAAGVVDGAATAADATATATDASAASSVSAGTYTDPNQQAMMSQPTSQYGAAQTQQAPMSQYGQQQLTAAPVQQSQYGQAPQPDVAQLQQQLAAYQQLFAQLQQQQQQQPQQAPVQQAYGQTTQNLAFNNNQANAAQMKVAATKRKRCGVGQIFSAEQQKCVDFSLAQSRRRK